MRLAPDVSAATQARHYARMWSAKHGVPGRVVAEIELVVDELVGNAVRHGLPPYELALFRADDVIRGEVRDGSNVAPCVNHDPDLYGGFGLHVVTNSTSRWGTNPRPVGKEVWFEIHARP